MPEAAQGQRTDVSRLRVFRPSRSRCLDTIVEHVLEGWRLTGIDRTNKGAYILNFNRRRGSHVPPRLPKVEGSVISNEQAFDEDAVDIIAARVAEGWHLTRVYHSEAGAYLLDFDRERTEDG